MKTEVEIINDLGEWLCLDLEKEIAKTSDSPRLPSTHDMEKRMLIVDIANRIKWYRDNVVKV